MQYILVTLTLYSSFSYAAQHCAVDELAKYTWNNPIARDQIIVEAEESRVLKQKAIFTGGVVAKYGDEVFYAEQVSYQRNTGKIYSPNNLTYGTPDFVIRADKADYSFNTQSGSFYQVDYFLSEDGVNGEAEQLDVNRKDNTVDLKEAVYSACPRLKRSWSIKVNKAHLDHDKGVGESWGTTFHLGKTPVFYFPYFSFPLNNQRKTGFLTPSLNLSETRGLDITIPYYINTASNQDATLYPRVMNKRGFMLGGEYRYLLPQITGSVSANYLPNDIKTDKTRWSFNTQHQYRPNEQFSLSARYKRISDKKFVEDFEDTLDLSNLNFLESHLKADYFFSPNYTLSGQFKTYQVANSDYTKIRPYNTLPKLSGDGLWEFESGLVLSSNTEFANFDKENTVSGLRLDQLVTASYPIERSYGFIEPSANYRMTRYKLRDQDESVDTFQSRNIPSFSIDSGLYFDRQMSWFGNNSTQSLEPRLFYLYTPYSEQSNLPVFDTALISTTYDSMFEVNRFNGKDRIGDANQLTTAISSSITDNDSGEELVALTVGQIQYFEDRNVSLLDSVSEKSRSNVLAEGHIQLFNNTKLRGLISYDADERYTEKSLLSITYLADQDKSISLSHLFDEDRYDQLDLSGVWRLNDQWRTFWRWNYSLEVDKTVDILGGIEYADCCWGLRLIARQQRENMTLSDEPENTVYLEFSLKGLGNIGSNTSKMLSDVIPNYRPIQYETTQ